MTAVLVAADVPAPPDDGLPPGQPYVSPDDLASIPPLFAEAAQVALLPLVAEIWQNSAGTVHAQLVDAANLPGLPPVSSLAAETYLAQAANTFSQVGDDLWNTARSELLAGFEAGESIPQLADRLRNSAGLTARKATLVARTQVLDASNAGSYATAQTSGIDLRKGWLDTPDARTRITHRAAGAQYSADQQMIPLADQFMVGGYSCDRPHDPVLPPAERYNCFPASTEIDAADIRRAYRRWFDGELIEIVDAEGRQLSGTPNHPVLTDRGWVALGELVETDKLVTYRHESDRVAGHDENAAPTLIGEIFDTFASVASPVRVGRLRVDFHGEWPDGDVDVVSADRELRNAVDSTVEQAAEDFLFPSADIDAGLLAIQGRLDSGALGSAGTTHSGVGGVGQPEPVFGAGSGHPRVHSFAAVPWRDTVPEQETSKSRAADWSLGSEALLGLAGQVSLDQVVAVRRVPWSGHVYNLETGSGAYVANGIVVHNCRCTTIFSMGPQAVREAQKAAEPVAPLPNTSGQIEPVITPALPLLPRVGGPGPLPDLSGRTVVQLRALAKQQGITGYTKLTKPQLLERLTPPPVSPFEAGRVLSGREALTSPALDLSGVRAVPGVSTAQRAALNEYMSDAQRINAQIRAGQMSQRVDRTVRQIDSLVAESPLRADTEVWRGLRSGAEIFRDAPADLTGFEWSETAFVSTTANRQVAAEFAGSFGDPAPVIVRVKAPAGTHGITTSEWGTGHAIGGQAEIVLERNLRFRVVADRGLVDEPGIPVKVRLVDVEVVPRSAPVLEGRVLREAARERNRIIEQRAAAEQTLAELDDLLVKKASREAFEERIAAAQLDPADLAALRAALGDPVKLRAQITRITKKQGITVDAKSGAKVKFDPALHDPVGEVPAAGTPVTVIRRGTTLTVDGDTITLNKAVVKLPTAPVKRAPAKAVKAAPKKAAVPEVPVSSDPRVAALPRSSGKPPLPAKAAKATNPKFGSTDQGHPTYRDAGKAGKPYTPDMGPLPSGAYEQNCSNVVNAFEMRMRGFDVQAAPLDVLDKYGYAAGRTVAEMDQQLAAGWRLADGSAHGRSFAGQQWRSFVEIDGEIDSTWPDGGRGFIFVGKHVFNVVKVRGKAVYYEAQFDANASRNVTALYKKKYKSSGVFSGPPEEAKLFRVDDLEPVAGILTTITPI